MDTSLISPKGMNAAWSIASLTFSSSPPTYRVVFGLDPAPLNSTFVVCIAAAGSREEPQKRPLGALLGLLLQRLEAAAAGRRARVCSGLLCSSGLATSHRLWGRGRGCCHGGERQLSRDRQPQGHHSPCQRPPCLATAVPLQDDLYGEDVYQGVAASAQAAAPDAVAQVGRRRRQGGSSPDRQPRWLP
jgi:hypothetical protein